MPGDEQHDRDPARHGLDHEQPTLTEGPEAATEEFGVGEDGLAVGKNLGGRYQVVGRLGAGGMGEVWRAFDLKLRVEVALKALREDLFRNEKRLEMLRQEVRAAREVVSPNVCRIFDLVEADGRELVSMEYVDGQTLLEVLQERGPLELKEAQDIASQFLAGLEAIHMAGLVHRDVKPENIMLTRAGRVVLMDFGLARQEDSGAGTVAGTPAYMAPEQSAGLKVDARADVYSAGVVLAEMVSPEGIRSLESRQSVWEGVRSEPARLPDSPWAPVLKKAVAREPDLRYNSAHTLTRALEEVTLRVEGAEDLHPYPGLASFTEEDAEYFFGRESEVEQMWAKLDGPPRLLGVVGPSGAGKTSFLRAGLIPSAGSGWAIVNCTPGNAAFLSLRQELVSELAGDAEALRELVDVEDLDATVSAVSRWRRRHEQALLIVDQFEELFTLNAPDLKSRFADLLGRLVLEADVFVLLAMRDDFFFHCHEHEALRPVITDLSLLGPPTGPALRRAVVQPATRCGYRFEDDDLVEEMLAEVEGERGALPLLAFAMARLWEKRDRENGLLTRQAYHEIGGVGGALARHAEATIDRIGSDRLGMVREILRNLVTAEGTRAVREWEELLSVFGESTTLSSRASEAIRGIPRSRERDEKTTVSTAGGDPPPPRPSKGLSAQDDRRGAAEEVLRQLTDARLLTSYEVREGDEAPTRRVEIIHESLLANWPRLVRWQTQDADAIQLRDQLRQAARTWDERDRTEDLLWTGGAYREFAVWQESYPGGLSAVEHAFADAMAHHAARRKRRRRMMLAAALTAAAAVAAVTTTLWRRSVVEARRAQATTLLMKAQSEIEDAASSEEALPYAIASLELWDQPAARRMALRALSLAPPLRLAPPEAHVIDVSFSPDGDWLAAIESFEPGEVYLSPAHGGDALHWQVHWPELTEQSQATWCSFVSGSVLATYASRDPVFRLWSVPGGGALQTLPPLDVKIEVLEDRWRAAGVFRRLGRFVRRTDGVWTHDTRAFDRMAKIGRLGDVAAALDLSGELLAYADGGDLYVEDLGDADTAPRLVGRSETPFQHIAWSPGGDEIATWGPESGMALWSPSDAPLRPHRSWAPDEPLNITDLVFDPTGTFLAAAVFGKKYVYVWDLAGPPAAEPWRWSRSATRSPFKLEFDPTSSWLAAAWPAGVALWPVERGRYPYLLHGHTSRVRELSFAPDGSWLVSSAQDGTVRWWPLTEAAGAESRVLFDWGRPWVRVPFPYYNPHFIAVAPDGSWVAATGQEFDTVNVVPVGGGEPRRLRSGGEPLGAVAVSPDGRRLAVGASASVSPGHILIWDLESDAVTRLETEGQVDDLQFLPDGSLLDVVSGRDWRTIGRWNLDTREREPVDSSGWAPRLALSADGRDLLRWGDEGGRELGPPTHVALVDLGEGTTRRLMHLGGPFGFGGGPFGFGGFLMALSDSGRIAVVPVADSLLVGRTSGGESQRILFQKQPACAISPDERWIATGDDSGEILLWPMPDLDRQPLGTLSHDELITTLRALTNLRAVRDDASADGWGIQVDPFPGWAEVPEW